MASGKRVNEYMPPHLASISAAAFPLQRAEALLAFGRSTPLAERYVPFVSKS